MEVVAGHSIVNYHFSLQKLATRLAVTFLPCPLVASSHQIISPGFLLSVSTSISGLALEIINAYLHPRRLPQLGNALLTHLQTPHSGSRPSYCWWWFNQLESPERLFQCSRFFPYPEPWLGGTIVAPEISHLLALHSTLWPRYSRTIPGMGHQKLKRFCHRFEMSFRIFKTVPFFNTQCLHFLFPQERGSAQKEHMV